MGAVTNLLGYLIYLLFTYWGVEPKVLITFMYPVGAAIGFLGNRQWAFAHEGVVWKSIARYCITHFFGYLMNLSILFLFVDELGYTHQWVQAAAIVLVAGFLFVAFKYFVFPRGEDALRVRA
ncbi:GtrA family protein [Neisseriaceae bacterium TC5R-5]|nr:GtrA family protein [Neisseriaceae bacterium TC5R-5]